MERLPGSSHGGIGFESLRDERICDDSVGWRLRPASGRTCVDQIG